MIYEDFQIILRLKENIKQIPNESFSNNYQEHVDCSYGEKLVCVDDKFIKPLKSYIGWQKCCLQFY